MVPPVSASQGTLLPRQRHAHPTRRTSLLRASRDPKSNAMTLMPVAAFGLDLFSVAVALLLSAIGHAGFDILWGQGTDAYVPSAAVAGPVIIVVWLLTIVAAGGYDRKVFGSGPTEFNRVLNASLGAAGVIGVGAFVFSVELSRSWYLMTFLIGFPLIFLGRAGLRTWTKRMRIRGLLQQRVVIVGDAAHAQSIAQVLERETWLGYHVVGAVAPSAQDDSADGDIPVLGETSEAAQIALEVKADVLIFTGGGVSSPDQMRTVAWQLEGSNVQTVVVPSVSDVSAERMTMRPVGGLPLIHLEQPRTARAARRAKRIFDVVGTSLILLAASPLIAFSALRIKLHDGGPVFFRQERIGRDGQPFGCFKFRTMVVDAEARLREVHQQQGSDADAMFYKLRRDPRITKPGHWLRRFSIDELPQLFNVLRGDMSLVGPRPQVAHEVALYEGPMSRRLHVRPGMTGLWQVSGRSDLPLEEAVRLDLYYVDNWSMMQDLAILARTLRAVVSSDGAY